jgi:hypothetical protein
MMMKAAFVAAMLAAGVSANHNHRHAHDLFKLVKKDASVCIPTCTTYYTTITGSPGRT